MAVRSMRGTIALHSKEERKLLQTNAKQAHFISSSIEVISQQATYIFKLEKQLKKKKATLWDRIRYVFFNKK